jgi:drug/metabolite transporter (DMT)-like permease
MHFPLHLLIPLASAIGYVAAVLLVKRSADFGVGIFRTTFVSNLAMGVCFAPLWLLGGPGQPWSLVWQPLAAGGLFFVGQFFTFIAQTKGDVSVATPMMGVKVLMVALASTLLLAEPIPLKWWFAAGLSTLGVALLGQGGSGKKHQRVLMTMLCAIAASTAFGTADVLIQKWGRAWGGGRFLPIMFGGVALASFALIPFFREPLRAIPRDAWRWLIPGTVLMAFQAAGLGLTMAIWGDATAANIVYSSRGLWSVIAVWLVGHWFSNREQHLGPAVLRWRLAGATAMLAAIVLVMT